MHADLAKPLRAHLAKWKTIEAEREDADDAMADANARVRWLDRQLDTEVQNLANRLLYELGRKTDHPTFRKFFPEAPTDVVRLGLESEIDRTKAFDKVADELGASKEVRATLKAMESLRKLGTAALSEREKVAETQGRVSLRISTWKESANDAQRSIAVALEKHALANGLPRTYAEDFFPIMTRPSKKNGATEPPEGGADAEAPK